MLNKFNKRRGGFTLVEIMIVVAIIALLAAIAVPGFLRARKRSQARQFGVMGALLTVNCDSANFQQMPQKARGKFRGIVNRQSLVRAGIVNCDRAPQRQRCRSRFAIDKQLPRRSRRHR